MKTHNTINTITQAINNTTNSTKDPSSRFKKNRIRILKKIWINICVKTKFMMTDPTRMMSPQLLRSLRRRVPMESLPMKSG